MVCKTRAQTVSGGLICPQKCGNLKCRMNKTVVSRATVLCDMVTVGRGPRTSVKTCRTHSTKHEPKHQRWAAVRSNNSGSVRGLQQMHHPRRG